MVTDLTGKVVCWLMPFTLQIPSPKLDYLLETCTWMPVRLGRLTQTAMVKQFLNIYLKLTIGQNSDAMR